uniref:COP9 signalosome complex subunit 6 n=1 Tax=Romanomermis culicivorax TaxID=13658 RepID=A0A915KN36_ROMCU
MVLAGAHSQASVTVSLHPLVLVNISDHFTRAKAQNNGQPQQVIGAIIGKQMGRHLELTNSFELPYTLLDGHFVIDSEYFKTRENQCRYKEVFADQEYLGWYNTGDLPTHEDVNMHKLYFSESNESPIFLKLNTQAKPSDQLPVRIFESIIEIDGGEATIQFLEINYGFVTEESERIGIDHVARCSITNAPQTSHVTEHFNAQAGAIKMLAPRLKLITEYMNAVEEGRLPQNQDLLRLISSLAACLPIAQSEAFVKEYDVQCNDISLAAYLGILTKQCASVNKLVNKINTVHEHRTSGPRGRRGFLM